MILIMLSATLSSNAQAPVLPEDDNAIYFGLYWGAAGIVKSMIDIISSDILSNEETTVVRTMINSALDGIWNNRFEDTNGDRFATWEKISQGSIYPGQKYGAAGIAKVFLNAYETLGNETYLDWAKSTIDQLYLEVYNSSDLPHWNYVYDVNSGVILGPATFITDLSFGSLGVIDATLDLYETIADDTYLSLAVDSGLWIDSISYNETVGSETGKIIPWYKTSKRLNNTYTSYMKGNAGALKQYLRLYDYTGDTFWFDNASFIANWLVDIQNENGSWTEASNAIIPTVQTDLENGVVGTLLGLFEANHYLKSTALTSSISNGISYLESIMINNATHLFFPILSNQDQGRYDLFKGMSGIANILYQVNPNHTLLPDLYGHLVSKVENIMISGMQITYIPVTTTGDEGYFDLSYAYGLAGYMSEMTRIYLSDLDFAGKEEVPSIIRDILTSFEHTQLENGLWPRQFAISKPVIENLTEVLVAISIVGLIVVFIAIQRRYVVKKS